ncbi:MAG: hypothetical protein U9Q68_10625 [Euryarchaeota archaeon]|nr:hypothetical protein [Euryarchaeota archaeon]
MPGCRGSLLRILDRRRLIVRRGWLSAISAGAVTADSVPFNLDSGTQNMIKFGIDDAAPNTGVMSIQFG